MLFWSYGGSNDQYVFKTIEVLDVRGSHGNPKCLHLQTTMRGFHYLGAAGVQIMNISARNQCFGEIYEFWESNMSIFPAKIYWVARYLGATGM